MFFPTVPSGLGKLFNHLIFFSNRSGVYQLFQINLDGSDLVQLSQIPDQDMYDMEPAWSPDGRIAFTSLRDDKENYTVYRMAPDGSNQTRLTDDPGDDIIPRRWPQTKFKPNIRTRIRITIVQQKLETYYDKK